MRRHSAGDEIHRLDEAWAEALAEEAHPVGDDHAIDPVLDVEMLVPDVEGAVGEIVLGDAGRLQQHLVEPGILAAGHVLDGLVRKIIGRGADRRLDVLPRLVEPLRRNRDLLLRLRRCCRRRLIAARLRIGSAADGDTQHKRKRCFRQILRQQIETPMHVSLHPKIVMTGSARAEPAGFHKLTISGEWRTAGLEEEMRG